MGSVICLSHSLSTISPLLPRPLSIWIERYSFGYTAWLGYEVAPRSLGTFPPRRPSARIRKILRGYCSGPCPRRPARVRPVFISTPRLLFSLKNWRLKTTQAKWEGRNNRQAPSGRALGGIHERVLYGRVLADYRDVPPPPHSGGGDSKSQIQPRNPKPGGNFKYLTPTK